LNPLELLTKRNIPVNFKDYSGHIIDKSLFNKKNYSDIDKNGINLSPIKIIHCASIHYSGRYKNSRAMQLISSFIELIPSVRNSIDGGLYLFSVENNEFQAKSSEVLAVGICIALSSQLFSINKNKIGLIEGSSKRCDFYFIQNSMEYFIESKGRKGSISDAVKDIFNKKSHYSQISPKYGVISHLPRDNKKVTVTIVDPEFTPKELNKTEEIRRLLLHYSRVAYMSGFWLLGEQLEQRLMEITSYHKLESFNNIRIDYGSIYKFGKVANFGFETCTGQAFIPKDNSMYGMREEYENYIGILLMDRKLIEILEQQNFDNLMSYKADENIENDSLYSVNDDGSIFAFILKKDLESYR